MVVYSVAVFLCELLGIFFQELYMTLTGLSFLKRALKKKTRMNRDKEIYYFNPPVIIT